MLLTGAAEPALALLCCVRLLGRPLRRKILVLGQAQLEEPCSRGQATGELGVDPTDEALARRDRAACRELRQRRVEVLVVQPLDDPLPDELVELAEIDDETGFGIDLSLNAEPQPIVVAMPRQVGALAKPRPVLLFAPIRAPVQGTGAEPVAALENDLHALPSHFGGHSANLWTQTHIMRPCAAA